MQKPQVTLTEVTIHPPHDLLSAGALRLQLAPEGDFLILHQDTRYVELDGADLPLLLEWGQRLLNQVHDAT
jgi:hypothetical protein